MIKNHSLNGETLCKECGLCCKGVFHTYGYLYSKDDLNTAKKSNISIEFNQQTKSYVFNLPCPSFDGYCTTYDDKPSACSIYQCDLLESMNNNIISFENASKQVEEIKNILDEILPPLKKIANDTSNKPEYLIEKILNHLENDSEREAFKNTHKILFMKCALFYFLENKYFNKKSVLLGMS